MIILKTMVSVVVAVVAIRPLTTVWKIVQFVGVCLGEMSVSLREKAILLLNCEDFSRS